MNLLKTLTKADIVLAVFLIILGIGATFFISAAGTVGGFATVSVDGQTVAKYKLETDRVVMITEHGHKNELEIISGEAKMITADCPDQYCVAHTPISKTNESIVCLPNKLIVSITSNDSEESPVDAISE